VTTEATGPGGAAVMFAVTATANVDGALTPVCTLASGSLFPLGDTTVTCFATDAWGNSASGSFHVLVQDTTAPSLVVPADVSVTTPNAAGATVTSAASANDAVDGAIAPACAPASGSLFAVGDTVVNCTAVDAHGNGAAASFTVHVQRTVDAGDLFDRLVRESTGVGPGRSLLAKALDARAAYYAGSTSTSCSTLGAYLNELKAQTGKKVDRNTAAELTALVGEIRALLGC
jgi:hypothetical protein